MIHPRKIRLEASTVCQLECPSCPTAAGEIGRSLGSGFLEVGVLKHILDRNPWIGDIELSNWGEIFLNPGLIELLKFSHDRGIALHARNGANLNDASEGVLEALVDYGLRDLTCSIDGAGQETYSVYRVKGNFGKVVDNINKLNEFKARRHSRYPMLTWQFVAFGHNEHEIGTAMKMAEGLNMAFSLKLSWEDLYTDAFSSIKNLPLIRIETGLGVANRQEYRKKFGKEYARDCCYSLWASPQINYDGRVLGCSVNYWDDYGNALKDGLVKCLNGEKMAYARDMLLGKKESRDEIPCSRCKLYMHMRENRQWIAEEDVRDGCFRIHSFDIFENNAFGYGIKKQAARVASALKRRLPAGFPGTGGTGVPLKTMLASRVYPLRVPLPAEEGKGWTPRHIFKGATRGLPELTCHASVLIKDHCPHDPHLHEEEELLLLLSGEVDLILQDGPASGGDHRIWRLKTGQFVYYPSDFAHTLRTTSDAPANYLMFKWRNDSGKNPTELAFGLFDMMEDIAGNRDGTGGFRTRLVFEGATSCLKKLHCHVSSLAPGAGYAPHADRHNVAAVILEGEVETLDGRAGPCDVVYYAAGEPHGMRNPAGSTARYIVFEFHER
ncbi:MAG: cupin domain-containing protein [Deltaproteobacteria bacterium]|nr:cupin domain-containing protein [Deltaproteobacteria bacterium]